MTAWRLSCDAIASCRRRRARGALRRIGAERYHNLHPFHRLLHGGKLNKGQVQAWALNRYYYQSRDPAQGRRADRPRRRPRAAPRVASAASSTTTATRQAGRHRALAAPDRRARPRPRLRRARMAGAPAGDPLRRRGLCPLRPRPHACSRRSPRRSPRCSRRTIIARARRRHAAELRLRHRGDAGLFHAAPDPGAARRRLRARLCAARRADTRRAAAGRAGGAALQVRRPLGAARRAAPRLCRARPDPARRLRTGRRGDDRRDRAALDAASGQPQLSGCASTRCATAGCVLAPERVLDARRHRHRGAAALRRRSAPWPPSSTPSRPNTTRRARRSRADVRSPCCRICAGEGSASQLDDAPPLTEPPLALARRADASLPAAVPLLLEPARARAARPASSTRRPGCRVLRRGGGARRAAGAFLRRRADGAARPRRARSRRAARAGLYTNLITSGVTLDERGVGRAGRGRARPRAAQLPGRRGRRAPTASPASKGGHAQEARSRRAGPRRRPAAHRQRRRPPPEPRRLGAMIDLALDARRAAGSRSRTCSITAGRCATARP